MEHNIYEQVDNYLSSLFALEDSILLETEKSIRLNGMPEHSVSANQGQFLHLLAKMCQAKTIIEIGTLGAYSTIWLARALNEEGKLYTIELDESFAKIARLNIKKAGLSHKVKVLTGNAIEVLEKLDLNGMNVDLFFMDADKPNYISYFNWAIEHSRPGSLIIADNVIRAGKVLEATSKDEKVIGVRAYNEMISKNKKVSSSILQQVGNKEHDGIAVSLVLPF